MALHVTRCPGCGSTFNTSARVLLSAGGLVRCGACLQVFEAARHLDDSLARSSAEQAGSAPGESVFISPPEDYFDPARFLGHQGVNEATPQASAPATIPDDDIWDVGEEMQVARPEPISLDNADIFTGGEVPPDPQHAIKETDSSDLVIDLEDDLREVRPGPQSPSMSPREPGRVRDRTSWSFADEGRQSAARDETTEIPRVAAPRDREEHDDGAIILPALPPLPFEYRYEETEEAGEDYLNDILAGAGGLQNEQPAVFSGLAFLPGHLEPRHTRRSEEPAENDHLARTEAPGLDPAGAGPGVRAADLPEEDPAAVQEIWLDEDEDPGGGATPPQDESSSGAPSPDKDQLRVSLQSSRLRDQEDSVAALSEENLDAVRRVSAALELEQHQPGRGIRGILLYGGLSVLLLAGIATLFYWQRMPLLSQDPRFRAWYETACGLLGCELPPYQDISLVQTQNLVVRSDPERPGTLQLTAVFRNMANFQQPFPVIELRFTNLGSQLVASRYFLPDEYLPQSLRGIPLMPVGAPVQINVELQDPGPDAVNYQLNFSPVP